MDSVECTKIQLTTEMFGTLTLLQPNMHFLCCICEHYVGDNFGPHFWRHLHNPTAAVGYAKLLTCKLPFSSPVLMGPAAHTAPGGDTLQIHYE
jgi:hypothetical protein